MISVYDKKEDCCGCTACKNICPNEAIEMKPDEEGFLYPVIKQELCTDCGLCRKICPLQSENEMTDRFSEPLVFAVKHKDEQVRRISASGGVYTAISDYALKQSYVVYGAEFDDDFLVQHNRATSAVERNKFRSSKYVQSNLKETFKQIQQDLTQGLGVLFTGTGCQVAGLVKYLGSTKTNTDRLITNDIICHGTPSPLLWEEYLNFVQKSSKLKSYTFRYKGKGWRGYNVKAEFENRKIKINSSDIKVYANLFSSNLALRPSCYHCRFASIYRVSDIMMGDYWGIEKVMPEIDDNRGISLVFVNTPKGKAVFKKLQNDLEIWKSSITDCLQPNLQYPTKRPEKRDQFWNDYYKHGFDYIAKKYAGHSFKGRLKRLVRKLLMKTGILEYMKKLVR